MCCIFTCCSWLVDLVQRFITFLMSCCIAAAVCCALVTASMAGIALGYNYSLAEYVDLKETNVSVYLKRGVFDDEIADDMDWRRSGHVPVAGRLRDAKLLTGAPEDEESSVEHLSGRRKLDDSIIDADDSNRYEGQLMRLTATPPVGGTSTVVTNDLNYNEINRKFPEEDSIDRLKAVQALVNQKKSGRRVFSPEKTATLPQDLDYRYFVPDQLKRLPDPVRRAYQDGKQDQISQSQLRLATPNELPYPQYVASTHKISETLIQMDPANIDLISPTFPPPVTLRVGPVRPTRPKVNVRLPQMHTTAQTVTLPGPPSPPRGFYDAKKSVEQEYNKFKENFMMNKNLNERPPRPGSTKQDDYYEDQGLPVRRRKRTVQSKRKSTTQLITNSMFLISKLASSSLVDNTRESIQRDHAKQTLTPKITEKISSATSTKSVDSAFSPTGHNTNKNVKAYILDDASDKVDNIISNLVTSYLIPNGKHYESNLMQLSDEAKIKENNYRTYVRWFSKIF